MRGVLADVLPWVYYMPLTFAIVIGFIVMPKVIVESSLNPVDLDAAQMQEMLFQRVIAYEYPYGTLYHARNIELADDPDPNIYLSNKVWGYKVAIKSEDSTEEFIDPDDYYGFAAPLAPIRGKRYLTERPFMKGIEPYTVIVDVVYPSKYEFAE